MPRLLSSVLALFLLALVPACRFGSSGPEERGYTVVFLKTGSKTELTAEEQQTIFAGHFANMQRLAHEKKLLLAGPFGKEKHDPNLRGLFVLDTEDPAQAQAWAETDPGFKANVFVLEFHSLRTHSALHALLGQELARQDADAAAGLHPEPGANGRGYVLLTAAQGAQMQHELAGQTFTLLHGRLDGGRGWAILDAPDPNAALDLIGVSREKMGQVEFDSWFATKGLEELPTLVDG